MNEINEEDSPSFDPISAVATLITGLILEGGHELLAILEEAEREAQPEEVSVTPARELSFTEKTGFMALGMLVESVQQTRRMVDQLSQIGNDISQTVEAVLNPLTDNFLLRPAKKRYEELIAYRDETLQR